MSSSLSTVYVLTTSAVPGLVKIGYTSQDDANARIAWLCTTGVPVPFTIEYACEVQNAEEVEKALHVGFDPNRINPKREFLRIEPDQAIAILTLFHKGEATREVTDQPSMVDQQSIAAAEQLRARRPNLDFEEMAIPMGTVLQSAHSDATVTVVATKKVRLADEETSPTAATRQVLGLDYSVQPGP